MTQRLADGDDATQLARARAEIARLRAELAGAEERGRKLEREAAWKWLYYVFAPDAALKYHLPGEAVRDAAEAIERGDHVRTGTTPPDAG